MDLSKINLAILSLVFVAFGYAMLSVVARLLNTAVEPFTQVYLRIGLAFVLVLLLFHKKISFKNIFSVSKKDWWLLLVMGTLGYSVAVILFTLAALEIKLFNIAVVASTMPFFVFLYSMIFLRAHVNKMLFFFLIISFWGVAIVSTKSLIPVLTEFGRGELLMLFSAAGFALYSVCRKLLSTKLNNSEITLVVIFIAFVSSFIAALMKGETFTLVDFSDPLFLFGLALGIFFNLANTYLSNFSFNYLNPVVGTQILLLENVFAPILGFFIYQEVLSPIEFFGAIIIIAGVVGANRIAAK